MSLLQPIPGFARPTEGPLVDRFGRRHTYLRVSVTDRCNYRCVYCMPAEGLAWLRRSEVLTYEEIIRLVQVFARMGVHRVRLTGGEPTVRRDLEQLVAGLAAIDGIDDLSMTTNGHLFARRAQVFADAGLDRVNVSLDTLDPDRFRVITRGGDLSRVLQSIDMALSLDLTPVKINCVVVDGENNDDVFAMVERFGAHAGRVVLRFIEYMPWDATGARRRHLPAATLRERLSERWTLVPAAPIEARGGPATGWRVVETGLDVAFISPITEHFCQACNRLRLQADGHLRTCLSREAAPPLTALLRADESDARLEEEIRHRVWGKVAGHNAHLEDGRAFEGAMSSVGG